MEEKWSECGKESGENSIRNVKGGENSRGRTFSRAPYAVGKAREM